MENTKQQYLILVYCIHYWYEALELSLRTQLGIYPPIKINKFRESDYFIWNDLTIISGQNSKSDKIISFDENSFIVTRDLRIDDISGPVIVKCTEKNVENIKKIMDLFFELGAQPQDLAGKSHYWKDITNDETNQYYQRLKDLDFSKPMHELPAGYKELLKRWEDEEKNKKDN